MALFETIELRALKYCLRLPLQMPLMVGRLLDLYDSAGAPAMHFTRSIAIEADAELFVENRALVKRTADGLCQSLVGPLDPGMGPFFAMLKLWPIEVERLILDDRHEIADCIRFPRLPLTTDPMRKSTLAKWAEEWSETVHADPQSACGIWADFVAERGYQIEATASRLEWSPAIKPAISDVTSAWQRGVHERIHRGMRSVELSATWDEEIHGRKPDLYQRLWFLRSFTRDGRCFLFFREGTCNDYRRLIASRWLVSLRVHGEFLMMFPTNS